MHPDFGALVAYRDRELGEQPAREVARHLETCPRCARQAEQVAADGELLLAADAPFRSECQPPSQGLERVLCGIREWKRSAAASPLGAQPSQRAEIGRRIGAQIEIYFGSETAARLERTAQRSADSPVAAVEPLLTAFLGRRAASAVIGKILDGLDQRLRLSAEAV